MAEFFCCPALVPSPHTSLAHHSLEVAMGASQARPHGPTAPLHLPASPQPPTLVHDDTNSQSSPPLLNHLATYLDWLFSLPPSSAPQFALYLLHLTQSTLLPPLPPPPLVDLIAAPPPQCYAAAGIAVSGGESTVTAPAGAVYSTLSSSEVCAMVWSVLCSRQRVSVCLRQMSAGPLLAACRIAQSLLAMLALPLHSHYTTSTTNTSTRQQPLHLLRSHQLTHLLTPLLPRIDWALSASALHDTSAAAAAYYCHEVTVAQLRQLRADVTRLLGLMREDVGWVRKQRSAVLLGVWRGQHSSNGSAIGGSCGGGGSLGVFAADRLFDVQLIREVFSYVYE